MEDVIKFILGISSTFIIGMLLIYLNKKRQEDSEKGDGLANLLFWGILNLTAIATIFFGKEH